MSGKIVFNGKEVTEKEFYQELEKIDPKQRESILNFENNVRKEVFNKSLEQHNMIDQAMTPREEFILKFSENLNNRNKEIYNQIIGEKITNKVKECIDSPYIILLFSPGIMQEKVEGIAYKIEANTMIYMVWCGKKSLSFTDYAGSFTILEMNGEYKITETNIFELLDPKEFKKYEHGIFKIERSILYFIIIFVITLIITIIIALLK